MKFPWLALAFALITAPASAQNAPLPAVAAQNAAAPQMATVTAFITGLKEPRGMALDTDKNLLICDFGAGEVAKFSRDGSPLRKLVEGLKGPTQIVLVAQIRLMSPAPRVIYVAESGSNRVVEVDSKGSIMPLGEEINEPIAMTMADRLGLRIISGSDSQIYSWEPPFQGGMVNRGGNTTPRPVAPPLLDSPSPAEVLRSRPQVGLDPKGFWVQSHGMARSKSKPYELSALLSDGDTYFASDVVGHRVLMISAGGRVAPFTTGISKPAGLAIAPDKMLYVANEGDGGQLIRLDNEGAKTVVAENLGRPNSLLFLDAKTLLVSNRDGNIWKVTLP